MRVAVCGYGYWGSRHARVLASLDGVELSVVDTDADHLAEASADLPGVRTYSVVDAPWSGFDAVVIATPPEFHLPVAMLALDGGANVFVEKPLAPSSAGAFELLRRAKALDKIVMVGHTYDYHAVINEMTAIVRSGDLGQIRHIDAARTNLGLHRTDVNVMWDLAPHDLGIILRMCGEMPDTVTCWQSDTTRSGVVDLAEIRLQFAATGVEARIRSSWIDPERVRKIVITGTTATLTYDETDFENPIRIAPRELTPNPKPSAAFCLDWEAPAGAIAEPLNQPEPLRVEMEHFLACVRDGSVPRTTGEDGLQVVRLLELADQSASERGAELEVLPSQAIRTVPATAAARP